MFVPSSRTSSLLIMIADWTVTLCNVREAYGLSNGCSGSGVARRRSTWRPSVMEGTWFEPAPSRAVLRESHWRRSAKNEARCGQHCPGSMSCARRTWCAGLSCWRSTIYHRRRFYIGNRHILSRHRIVDTWLESTARCGDRRNRGDERHRDALIISC